MFYIGLDYLSKETWYKSIVLQYAEITLVFFWSEFVYFCVQSLEENVITFVKNELKNINRILCSESSDHPVFFGSQTEDKDVDKPERIAREGALDISLYILRNINQMELADKLEKSKFLKM